MHRVTFQPCVIHNGYIVKPGLVAANPQPQLSVPGFNNQVPPPAPGSNAPAQPTVSTLNPQAQPAVPASQPMAQAHSTTATDGTNEVDS